MQFHEKIAEIQPENPQKYDNLENLKSDKLLVHPFLNEDSVFFGRTDLEENAFVELTPE